MTDRSVQAGDISGSVVVTGDGNAVTLTFGDTRAHLRLERRQVRLPDRRRAARPGEPARELDLFRPDTDALPLLGREPMLADLMTWLDDDTDLSVRALAGQAGSGKTRLAVELCRAVDPADGKVAWLAGFVSPGAVEPIVDALVTRRFDWKRPTLIVLDYAATAHRALGRWLDALAAVTQTPKLRFLLLEREASEEFGWWPELARPGLNTESRRRDLFWPSHPVPVDDLSDSGQRRAIMQAAQQAALRVRGCGAAPWPVPPAGQDPDFDRALAQPRFGNPLNLVMAGVIASEQTALGALGLRRLDAARRLADRELARFDALATARRIDPAVMRHMIAFNGLAGGLPASHLPEIIAAELCAWNRTADPGTIADLLQHEFPPRIAPGQIAEAPRLATVQPDLIGEATVVRAFEGTLSLAGEAIPAVRRAFALGQARAAESLMRIVQDFAYALEDASATKNEKATGEAVMTWLTDLAGRTDDPIGLLPLVFALPAETTVLREPAALLTARLSDAVGRIADETGDSDMTAQAATLRGNLAMRLSALGRREDALAAAEDAVRLSHALADARPDAFTSDLARSLSNLAKALSEIGRREDALAAADEALRLFRILAEARPDVFTSYVARSLTNLALMLSNLGRREDAVAAATDAVRLYRPLAAMRPDAYIPDLARSLNNLTKTLSEMGRRQDALAAAAEAVRLDRALSDARPDAFTPSLARSLTSLASMLSDLGRRDDALVPAADAVRLYRDLARARPDAYTPDLAWSLLNLTKSLVDTGRREDAMAAAAEAVSHYRTLADARPNAYTADLARSLTNLALMLSDLGRREDALAAAEDAVRLFRPLADARPDVHTPDFAKSLNNLTKTLSEMGRREDALAAAAEAVRLYRALADARPNAYTADLARSLSNLALMLSAAERHDDARVAAEDAVRLYRAMADAHPDAHRSDLARSLSNLALMLGQLGLRNAALEAAGEAVHLYQKLADTHAGVFDLELGRAMRVLGDRQVDAGEIATGIGTLARSLKRLTPAFAALPMAVRDMIVGATQSYLAHCDMAGVEPDTELIEPIVATLQRISQANKQ